MCIAAWITAKYNANHNSPNSGLRARVRYILFVSIWTIVTCSIYLSLFITMAGSMLTSVASHFVLYVFPYPTFVIAFSLICFSLLVTWIFWLAAAAAFTESVGGSLNCSVQTKFVYCGQLNALEGFAWLIWFVFSLLPSILVLLTAIFYRVLLTFMLIFVLIRGIIVARRGDGVAGPMVEV